MKELTAEQKESLKGIHKAEMKESLLYFLLFVPFFVLSVGTISAIGTFLLHSPEFIQFASVFNGVFMAYVFLLSSKKRSDKYRAQVKQIYNQ